MNGLDRLLDLPRLPYADARVGFLGHAASVASDGRHAIEHLRNRPEWSLVCLLGPEHGFAGTFAAGEEVDSSQHPVWNLPIISLYGDRRAPSAESLADLDLLVIDLQDLGVRCYTYATTLALTLRACTEANLPVLVLDRPTPLAGIVDGPELSPDFQSFVGHIPLPLVYGLSQAQLACYLQQTDPALQRLRLETIPYATGSGFFTPFPSPAIVSAPSVLGYPLSVWCEAIADVTVERGQDRSFQVWGMPDFPTEAICTKGNWRGGMPKPTRCRMPDGRDVPGIQWQVTDLQAWRPVSNAIHVMACLRDEQGLDVLFNPERCRPDFFDQLMGTDRVRKALQAGESAEAIVQSFPAELPLHELAERRTRFNSAFRDSTWNGL